MRCRWAVAVTLLLFRALAPIPALGDQVTPSASVTTGLFVRSAPSGGASLVATLYPGQRAELLNDVPYWHYVRLQNGKKGYVWKGLADVVPDPPPVTGDDLLGALLSIPAIARDAEAMNVHLIDVGQGAATLFEFPCGTLLIDTGGEDNAPFNGVDRLLTYLDSFFARRPDLGGRLDVLILTHPHKDHTFGACKVISKYRPKNLVDNGAPGSGPGRPGQQCLQDAAATGVPYHPIDLDEVDHPGGITSDVIDPLECDNIDPEISVLFGRVPASVPGWSNTDRKNANNNSVVTRVDLGQFSMLVTGDLEDRGIRELLQRSQAAGVIDVDVYQVGHHGSHNGTTGDLMAAMTPEIALMAMGDRQRQGRFSAFAFGHPNHKALALLVDATTGVSGTRPAVDKPVGLKGQNPFTGAPPEWTTWTIERAVYGTGWDGSVIIQAKADGTAPVVTTSRP